jgi:hypothetical protein
MKFDGITRVRFFCYDRIFKRWPEAFAVQVDKRVGDKDVGEQSLARGKGVQ